MPLPRIGAGRNTHVTGDHGLQHKENGEASVEESGQLFSRISGGCLTGEEHAKKSEITGKNEASMT